MGLEDAKEYYLKASLHMSRWRGAKRQAAAARAHGDMRMWALAMNQARKEKRLALEQLDRCRDELNELKRRKDDACSGGSVGRHGGADGSVDGEPSAE